MPRAFLACALALSLIVSAGAQAQTAPASTPAVSAKAQRRIATIDSLGVERLWQAGVHVDWRSGEPDGRPIRTEGRHTHCSAFVAAAAERVGIYILRPPEHGQTLLANAQADWLASDGRAEGWTPIENGVAAQAAANRGDLVVAVYQNHNPRKAGHIAIVRPGAKTPAQVAEEGPDVTQAGTVNARTISLRQGFAGHPRAFRDGEARYFAHP